VNWTIAAAQQMLPSLMGHMLFGLVLGTTYVLLRVRMQPAIAEQAAAA